MVWTVSSIKMLQDISSDGWVPPPSRDVIQESVSRTFRGGRNGMRRNIKIQCGARVSSTRQTY